VRPLLDGPVDPPRVVGAPPHDGAARTAGSSAPLTHDDERCPTPRHDAAVLDVGDEWVLHVAATDEVHRFDSLGVRLWERLDGRRSVGELIAEVTTAASPGERELVAVKIRGFVAELEALQLVD
jgi:hypothetical protein